MGRIQGGTFLGKNFGEFLNCIIEVKNLVKSYGEVTAVDDISFLLRRAIFSSFWDRMGQEGDIHHAYPGNPF